MKYFCLAALKCLLFHGEIVGLPIGLVLLALGVSVVLSFFLTRAYRKSSLVLLLWALGLFVALFCFVAGVFFLWVGIQEVLYSQFD
jgi:hypothetical protein